MCPVHGDRIPTSATAWSGPKEQSAPEADPKRPLAWVSPRPLGWEFWRLNLGWPPPHGPGETATLLVVKILDQSFLACAALLATRPRSAARSLQALQNLIVPFITCAEQEVAALTEGGKNPRKHAVKGV